MTLQFNQFNEITEGLHLLNEKQIIVGGGANYGQIVFLVGGAGSGKGFALKHFLQGTKFKVRDVDAWKAAFLKLAALKQKYPELRILDMNVPDDVTTLHNWVKKKGIKDKTLDALLSQVKVGKAPNIIFDISYKEKNDIDAILPSLIEAGYNPINVHVIWVLTNYGIAVMQNRDPKRGRVVSDQVMLDTHEGASNNMYQMIVSGTPSGIDGSVHIILGGKDHTVFFKDADGEPLDGSQKSKYGTDRIVIKDFKYLTLKEPGKEMTSDADLRGQAMDWIVSNVPRTMKNKGIFQSDEPVTEAKENPLPQIYCDMDQVLVDFLDGAEKVLGKSYTDKKYWNSPESADKKVELTKNAPHLYKDLKWMSDGKKLWKFISKHSPKILSAHPTEWMPNAKDDKKQWLKNNIGSLDNADINIVARSDKRNYAISKKGQPNILIDDHTKNIKEWNSAGGIGILHTSSANTIAKLKKMGF